MTCFKYDSRGVLSQVDCTTPGARPESAFKGTGMAGSVDYGGDVPRLRNTGETLSSYLQRKNTSSAPKVNAAVQTSSNQVKTTIDAAKIDSRSTPNPNWLIPLALVGLFILVIK